MLNLSCVICAEIFKPADDVHVTTCGHMFHYGCLLQWLERSKTCPQCRKKCTERNIIRIYFNLANLDISHIDIGTLQEQLDNANLQVKIKENDHKKAAEDVKNLKAIQRNCLKTIAGLEEKLKKNEFTILRYSEQVQMLKTDAKMVEGLRKEIKTLKQQIETMEGISSILTINKSDADQMLKNENNPQILAVWVTTLKRELRNCEAKKTDLRNVLKIAQSDLRKEIEIKKQHMERISHLESENYELNEKLKVLKTISASANKPNQETNASSGFTNNFLASVRDEGRRATISPTIKENIKKIEESDSPYLNIKSSSVGLVPLFKRHNEGFIATNTKPIKCNISPIKASDGISMVNGAVRKASSDLGGKYSIFKKPRMGLVGATASTNAVMKPLAPYYAFNGFGGSEKVDPWQTDDNDDKDAHRNNLNTKPAAKNLVKRLKSGGLRNFKESK